MTLVWAEEDQIEKTVETKHRVYIGRIFIDSVHHRKGCGLRLMECVENRFPFAEEFDPDTPVWNERTNAFYKKAGYRVIKAEDGSVCYQKSEQRIAVSGMHPRYDVPCSDRETRTRHLIVRQLPIKEKEMKT